ncbi:hypothetical protein ABZY02_35510 [Streptomyces sp. NPDC006649]
MPLKNPIDQHRTQWRVSSLSAQLARWADALREARGNTPYQA